MDGGRRREERKQKERKTGKHDRRLTVFVAWKAGRESPTQTVLVPRAVWGLSGTVGFVPPSHAHAQLAVCEKVWGSPSKDHAKTRGDNKKGRAWFQFGIVSGVLASGMLQQTSQNFQRAGKLSDVAAIWPS